MWRQCVQASIMRVLSHFVHTCAKCESNVCMRLVLVCRATQQCVQHALHLFCESNVCTAQAVLDKYTPGAAAELSLPLKRLQSELLCHVALDPCFSCNAHSEKNLVSLLTLQEGLFLDLFPFSAGEGFGRSLNFPFHVFCASMCIFDVN